MKRGLFVIAGLVFLVMVFAMQPVRNRPPRKKVTEDKRVYLVHADNLHYDQYRNRDAQVLNGHVHFRHVGANLYCDSAHFYEASNSFEAFGHVRMYQGDTLSLLSDYAFYDGNDQLARARYNVVLKNRQTTLYTDSLDYDRLYDNAYFFEGGKMVDGQTTLTSDWGEYNTKTKMSVFNYDVKMRSPKFYLTTDTLYYDNARSIAHIVGPSRIFSGSSEIYSEQGYYDTRNDRARLMNRSVLNNGGKTLVGDSVYYDSKLGLSKAFRDVIYDDTTHRNRMTGNYGEYNENTGYAMCTDSAVAIDYSQGDSLYMHADTFKVFTYNINTDSVYRVIHGYNHVRAFRTDIQAVCDSLVYNSKDSCMTMYRDPIVWNQNQQLLGEQIDVFMRDSVIDRAHVIGQAFSTQQLRDSVHFNQVASREMYAFFENGEMRQTQAIDNVLIAYYFEDDKDSSLICLNSQETTEMRMFLKNRKLERVWTPKSQGTLYPLNQIPASKKFLPGYAWFDYIRPTSRNDIFLWRGKAKEAELKPSKRREAPLQKLSSPSSATSDAPSATTDAPPGSASVAESSSTQPPSPSTQDAPPRSSDRPANRSLSKSSREL